MINLEKKAAMPKPTRKQVITEHNAVMAKREAIHRLFERMDIDCGVTAGGSYSLAFNLSEFSDREIHDYDFIVRIPSHHDFLKASRIMRSLFTLGIITSSCYYAEDHAYHVGKCLGKDVDVILVNDVKKSTAIEHIDDVLAAKKEYVRSLEMKGESPRKKDLDDIEILESICKLPF